MLLRKKSKNYRVFDFLTHVQHAPPQPWRANKTFLVFFLLNPTRQRFRSAMSSTVIVLPREAFPDAETVSSSLVASIPTIKRKPKSTSTPAPTAGARTVPVPMVAVGLPPTTVRDPTKAQTHLLVFCCCCAAHARSALLTRRAGAHRLCRNSSRASLRLRLNLKPRHLRTRWQHA